MTSCRDVTPFTSGTSKTVAQCYAVRGVACDCHLNFVIAGVHYTGLQTLLASAFDHIVCVYI
jgi:hypothetical protein